MTISVISEYLSPIYQIVSEKLSLKNPKIYKEMYKRINGLPSSNSSIFFVTDYKELKLAQTP